MKRPALSPLLIIFLTVFIDMVGFGIVIPILPLYSETLHATPFELGMVLASFSLMQLIFTPILGRLSDRVGRKPVLTVCLFGTALGFLILGFAHTLWLLLLGRIIDGITGGNISTAQAYIADVTPPEKRSKSMGLIGAAFGLGFMFGPAIGGLLGQFSLEAPFFFAAGISALNAFALTFFLPESLPAEKRVSAKEHTSMMETLSRIKDTPLFPLMLCTLTSMISFSGVTALFTLFTEHRFGWHAEENGWLFAYIGLLGVIVQGGLIGRLVPRVGERSLILVGLSLLIVSIFLFPIDLGDSTLLVWIGCTGLSIGNGFLAPVLSGWTSRSTDPRSQGVVMGVMQGTSSLGRLLGPFLGGLFLQLETQHPGIPYGTSLFVFGGVMMIVAFLVALNLRSVSSPVVLLEQQA